MIKKFFRNQTHPTNILYLGGFIRRTLDKGWNLLIIYLPFKCQVWYNYETKKLHFNVMGYMWKEKQITFKFKIFTKV